MNQPLRNRILSVFSALVVFPGAGAAKVLAQAPESGQGTLRSINDPAPAKTPANTTANAPANAPGGDRLTPSELEELLGPIALYPDPLLANVLAAAVYPDEVAEAAKFVAGGGKAEQVDAKPWEDPVKAVAKIPDAIKMMGQYNDWTIALGQAYLIQAKDVMDVVQSLRKQAQDNGALKSSPQQTVVAEQEVIYIKPADPEIIYVPSYNPQVVYVEHHNNDAAVAGIIGFGAGIATGLILANNLDCDWHGGCVGYGGGGWHGGGNEINVNGDVNIGNRNTNVNRNDVRNNTGNRVGNEGNAWSPNKSKSLASAKPNGLSQFKGGATGANRAAVPGGRRGTANAANRPAGAGARPAPAARPSAQPGGARQSPARSPSAGASSRVPKGPPRQSSGSAFEGGRGTQAQSQRGASSRAQSRSSASPSSASRGGGGAARSGGGGSRGGGGGGRGGGGGGRGR